MQNLKDFGIGDRIKSVRKALGLSQAELAKALDMVPSSLSVVENNRTMPSVESLLTLKEKFDVSLLYLMADEGKMFTTPDDMENYTVDYKKLKIIPREATEFFKNFEESPFLQFKLMSIYQLIKNSNPSAINDEDNLILDKKKPIIE